LNVEGWEVQRIPRFTGFFSNFQPSTFNLQLNFLSLCLRGKLNLGMRMKHWLRKFPILGLTLFPVFLQAGNVPREPILRINTEMHSATINRIGVDRQNRFLVTGSDDKTVRLWGLSSGRHLQVFRPPIGYGNEGRIYAVAISPDGNTIACGGWTGWEWDGNNSIYLFDRKTGRLKERLTGHPSVINHLTYSKDRKYLAACLGGKNGIRIYRTSDYSLVGEDRDYGSRSYGAEFDKKDRLTTVSYDGYVRLYNNRFKLTAKSKAPGGKRPFSVSFSPDGRKIAVGFDDSTKVNVLSGRDLSYLYSPDTEGVYNGSLGGVTWSKDGETLYAGGMFSKKINGKWFRPIRKWGNQGRGSYRDLPAPGNTIMQILPLNNSGIVFGGTQPDIGVFNEAGKKILYKGPAIANFRSGTFYKRFCVSRDGAFVSYEYKPGASPAHFSIMDRLIELDPRQDANCLSPVISAPGLSVTDWDSTYSPKLNGVPLKLDQYERSDSLSISPDQKSFLLGTIWDIRYFDSSGSELWNVPVPGIAQAVNITRDGRIALAALNDGTIRWYRLSDGKNLLNFFPHNDKKRWVLWTPSGYYDASPGGESLIGWHVNNGKDQAADFFPASQFRSKYYRPDVISKILKTLDEEEALRLANQDAGLRKKVISLTKMLPPVLRILSPENGAEVSKNTITIRYSIRSPSGEPITGIKALIDGRPVSQGRGFSITSREDTRTITVTIPSRDCEVSLIAKNRFSSSEPSTVSLRWVGEKEFVIKPKLYVLSVGVGAYENTAIPKLRYAGKDAKDFARVLERQKGGIYRDVVVKVLSDQTATKGDILDGLDWIERETTAKDVAMIFIAGHGVNDRRGLYYFLPVNADPERLKRTGLAFSDIKNTVDTLPGKTLLFVDTCHSGNVMGTRRGVADITAVVNELSSAESGAVVFASSTGNQFSLEDPAWENGAFTEALVEGLGGKADYGGTGRITVNMLDLYVSERVKELTKGQQTPTTTKPHTVPDFPVAIKK